MNKNNALAQFNYGAAMNCRACSPDQCGDDDREEVGDDLPYIDFVSKELEPIKNKMVKLVKHTFPRWKVKVETDHEYVTGRWDAEMLGGRIIAVVTAQWGKANPVVAAVIFETPYGPEIC